MPAWVPGFARGWWARTGAIGFTASFVGAIDETSSFVNGVVYAVSDEELDATDKREQGYERMDVTNDIKILGGSKQNGRVWIYVNEGTILRPRIECSIGQGQSIRCGDERR